MVFVILFFSSLTLLLLFVAWKSWRLNNKTLQTNQEWFRMDVAEEYPPFDTALLRQTLRRHIRSLLKRALGWYQKLTHVLRMTIRKRIRKILMHYDEENDPLPSRPRSKSKFLDEMHTHKTISRGKKQGLHSDFPNE